MDIKHVTFDPQSMSQDGDSILKSLQNNHLPIIDLIVRESIQNSLDAGLKNTERVAVDFYLGDFSTKDLAPELEGVSRTLIEKYPGQHKYLAFGDKNTSGLNGVYDSEDPELLKKSNYQKLIFDIGKKQEREGAGGSWGLGKTSYFRSGVGIVIYYTRIKTRLGYEERLVGSLIESPKQDIRLAPDNPRGIAWWGSLKESTNKLLPIIDGKEIEEFLNIFNLKRYDKDDTGTMVIIPYYNPEKSLNLSEEKNYYWENDIESDLKMAIQRWYMPRIFNPSYTEISGQPFLLPSVNGKPIIPGSNTEDTFEIFYDLYNSALLGEVSHKSGKNLDIFIDEIKFPRLITNKSNDIAGRVAYCEVSREDLNMVPPENKPSPLAYIGQGEEENVKQLSSKILAFARKPGMIVKYSVDEDWLPKSKLQPDDKLLLAFYVPNSSVKLHSRLQEANYTDLESYLRDIETADHAEWTDIQGINIIKRTKAEINKRVLQNYETVKETRDGDLTSALARKFGNLFVPLNQGKRSTPIKKQPKKRTSRVIGSRPSLKVLETTIATGDLLEAKLEILLPKDSAAEVSLKIETQDRVIDYRDWTKNIGNQENFPIKIIKARLLNNLAKIRYYDDNKMIVESMSDKNVIIEIPLTLKYLTLDFLPFFAIKSVEKGGGADGE